MVFARIAVANEERDARRDVNFSTMGFYAAAGRSGGHVGTKEKKMKFPCSIEGPTGGRWTVRHASADLGDLRVTAASREEAMEKMRDELRYRLELCPCTGDQFQHLEIELVTSESMKR
jgi:hypothetical protein